MSIKLLLYMFIFVLLGALFLEGTTRLFLTNEKPSSVVPSGISQFDDMLGWSLKPLSQGISNRTGYDITYQINSKGLRNDETSYEKPDGIFRIVLVGDSRTFGFGVPIEKHFSKLLEGYFLDVEVINMGVSGFGVDQELLFLRSEGFRYEPDLVLAYVAHYVAHRHMHTNRFGKEKPRFVLIDGELVLTNSPVANSTLLKPRLGTLKKIHWWFVRHSQAYSILRDGLLNIIEQEQHQGAVQQKQENKKNLEDEAFKKELHILGEALVFAMHEDSSKHGATFVLISQQVKQLHEASLDKQILSFDVSRTLSNPYFPLPDELEHINESGNGALAWEIATFLQANMLLPIEHLKYNQP